MANNLIQIIKELGDNFAVQDESILINDILYYFTKKNDHNIYKGYFKGHHKFGYIIFHNVEIYNGSGFQSYAGLLSTTNIDKIYYL
jgi:hypothetical protein